MTWINRCHFGDVREVLRRMAADGVKVNTIVTSPPYWGLRSYLPADHPDKKHEIGSEKTFAEFLAKMVDVFELCREVLADDGTMWVNMGDSYASGDRTHLRDPDNKNTPVGIGQRRPETPAGLKPKDIVGQPWRLAFALQEAGWYLRQDIIWAKPNPMPESVRDRCTKAHEYIFLLSKQERYYYDFDAMQEPVTGGANPRRAGPNAMRGQGQNRPEGSGRANRAGRDMATAGWKTPDGWDTSTGKGGHGSFHKEGREKGAVPTVGRRDGPPGNPPERKLAEAGSGTKNNESMDEALSDMRDTRNRRSVWTVPSEPYSGAHFATFPTRLIEPCIMAGCPEGGTVLDIFFGSGTTGEVAQDLGRNWIGIDLNRANEPLQQQRLANKDQRRRQRGLLLEAA